jgi:hypothetical protein
VCNLDLKLCEKVSEDKVNYFLYNFNLKNDIFANEKVPEIFKRYCKEEGNVCVSLFLSSFVAEI